jgi:hypothetical protein
MTLDSEIQAILDELSTVSSWQLEPHFRMVVFNGQLGPLSRFLTHDQKIHGYASPIPGSEQEAAADFLIQAMLYLRARGLSIDQALADGKARMSEHVFAKKPVVKQQMVVPGEARGVLRIWGKNPIAPSPPRSVVVALPEPYQWEEAVHRLPEIGGVILRNAGALSHPVTICRELNIPCWIITDDPEWNRILNLEWCQVHVSVGGIK